MLTPADVHGVIVAIVTPFTDSGDLHEDALRTITSYVLEGGVDGIMTTGGTGEFPSLSRDERQRVTRVVVEEVANRVPVFAGTAACSTWETILLSQDAREAGADAVIVTAPYYFRLPLRSLFQHYRDLARSADLPVVVYNNPLYTGNNLPPELIAELAGVDGVIGVKQSNPDLGQLVELIRLAGDRISLCTGIDSQFYPSLCAGAQGIFSTAACVIPREMAELYAAFRAGHHGRARHGHRRIQTLNRFLEYDPGYVAPCKEALRLLGLPGGRVRPPLPDLTDVERAAMADALMELGLLKSGART
ncbi:MAG: 4-hydroxy-tetrahydrodipicolinate synthase [Planctomycetes bacterium]|nr:4-hydroxy-tetrahydrodipicolinate synthase [Planctomycetota bacterium]